MSLILTILPLPVIEERVRGISVLAPNGVVHTPANLAYRELGHVTARPIVLERLAPLGPCKVGGEPASGNAVEAGHERLQAGMHVVDEVHLVVDRRESAMAGNPPRALLGRGDRRRPCRCRRWIQYRPFHRALPWLSGQRTRHGRAHSRGCRPGRSPRRARRCALPRFPWGASPRLSCRGAPCPSACVVASAWRNRCSNDCP